MLFHITTDSRYTASRVSVRPPAPPVFPQRPFSMRDPLSLLPLALAAGDGHIDGFPATQLVAAGVTLLQRCAPLVRALAGRRAAILLPTGPGFLVALAACEGRGAVLVNPLAAPPEVAYQCRDADVGAVFTIASLVPKLPAGLPCVVLDAAPRSATVLADGAGREIDLGSHVGLMLEGEVGIEGAAEEAAIVYTSAMAGTPLGAILTHENLLANARSTIEASRATADDHMLALLPFSHLFGLTVTGIMPLLTGGRVTTMGRFNPVRALELLEQGTVTQLVGVPAVFIALLQVAARRGARVPMPALRVAMCGGAPLDPSVQEQWAEVTGSELRQGYGLTEAAPVCLFNHVDDVNRHGTLGRPFPGVDVAICKADGGAELPVGVGGEICVRGANVSPGYVSGGADGLPRRGGWLRTGDIGVANADGTVSFVGVLKPMFTRSGFNVYPREIERAVLELAGVEAVHVVPVPEPTRENDILLTVRGDVTPDAVRRWCEGRLSSYKQPAEIRVTPA